MIKIVLQKVILYYYEKAHIIAKRKYKKKMNKHTTLYLLSWLSSKYLLLNVYHKNVFHNIIKYINNRFLYNKKTLFIYHIAYKELRYTYSKI